MSRSLILLINQKTDHTQQQLQITLNDDEPVHLEAGGGGMSQPRPDHTQCTRPSYKLTFTVESVHTWVGGGWVLGWGESTKKKDLIALNTQGTQQQRPESPAVTPPAMRVNTGYINSPKVGNQSDMQKIKHRPNTDWCTEPAIKVTIYRRTLLR